MKIRQWLFELLRKQSVTDGRTDGRMHGRTDARTDGRTDNVKTVYPLQTKFAGGIMKYRSMRSDDRSWPIRLADLSKCYDSCNYRKITMKFHFPIIPLYNCPFITQFTHNPVHSYGHFPIIPMQNFLVLLINVPVNNFSIILGWFPIFLRWTSTKQRIKYLPQGHNTMTVESQTSNHSIPIQPLPSALFLYNEVPKHRAIEGQLCTNAAPKHRAIESQLCTNAAPKHRAIEGQLCTMLYQGSSV